MEYLVSQNLESVTNVTDKVTEQVRRRRWSKQVGTWALFLSILVSFCITFMILRIIPKRQRRRAPEASEQSLYRSSHWKYHQRKKDPLDDTFDTKAASNDDNYGTMMCNSRISPTNFGEGHTPLQLALSMHGEEHSVSKILRSKEREGYDGDDYNYNM